MAKIPIFIFIFLSAQIAYAIDYVPLQPDAFGPGVVTAASSNLTSFLSAVFSFAIAAAVALALIQIIRGGIIKMTTDSWQGKSASNEMITNAVYGLGLVLVSWLVLYTINPTLVSFSGNTFLNPVKPPTVVRNDKTNNYKISTTLSGTSTEVLTNNAKRDAFLSDVNKIINPLGASTGRTSCGSGTYACTEIVFNSAADNTEEKIRAVANALRQSYFEVDIRVPTGSKSSYYGVISGSGSMVEDASLTVPLLMAKKFR